MADKKILIIEDRPVAEFEIAGMVKKLGYTVTAVIPSAEAGLAAVRDKNRPDLALIDIMPGVEMDAAETAALLRSRFNIPVIYLTARVDEQTLKQMKITEQFACLMKPYEEKDLSTAIEIALYKHSMEEKLRESELRYSTLFEGAGDAIFILDAEGENAGRIVDANQAAANMHGYSIDQLCGLNIRDLDSPDAAGEATDLMDRMLKGEWIKKEMGHRRKDGTTFPVEISAGLLVLANHRHILAIDRDVSERKKAEDEKSKTEAIIAAMGDGISIQDTDFKVLYQNRVLREMVGEHKGEYCYNAYERNKDICEGCGIALSFRDGKTHTVERSVMTDRGIVYVELTASPVRDSSGKIIAGVEIVRDVTARKETENELRRNYVTQSAISSLLQLSRTDISLDEILKQALDIILSIPWLSIESRGAIFLADDDSNELVMKTQKGLAEELKKKCASVQFGVCMCGRAAATGVTQFAGKIDERHDILYEGIPPHGHYCVPIVSAGRTLGVINLYLREGHPEDGKEKAFLSAIANVLAGVVQRKQAEEERERLFRELNATFEKVSRSHREWQNTFDSITDLIYITDPEYKIIKANKAFAEYCGITPKQAINKKCHELFYKSDSPVEKCPHSISMRELKLAQTEYIDKRTNRTLYLTAYPYFSDKGQLNGSIVVGKDVTEEKERDMRLIMSERLASLGQMVSSIAHEINNPLAAIAGCTEGLLKRVEQGRLDPELFRSYLKIIEEEILRCKNITSGMLSFVRKTTYDKQVVDIHKTLDKTIEIIGFQGRLKEVEIIRDYKEGMPHIQGSEGELRQVFLAIITNALDVMEDRGSLTLETGSEGEEIFVKISDTGSGIPRELISRVFEPFFTTKGEKGGTGLGLAIANKIITNHKGSIDVISETGKGTTFRIILPL